MNFINSITPNELSVLANAIALALADDKTSDELNVLGNFIVAVGSLLLTIAAQQQSLQAIQEKQQQMKNSKNESKN